MVESEAEQAGARGLPYLYPTWQQALSKFEPGPLTPAEDDADEKAAVAAEASPGDRLVGEAPTPTPENEVITIGILAEQVTVALAERNQARARVTEPERECNAHGGHTMIAESSAVGLAPTVEAQFAAVLEEEAFEKPLKVSVAKAVKAKLPLSGYFRYRIDGTGSVILCAVRKQSWNDTPAAPE